MNREKLIVHLKTNNYWWTEGSVKDADHGRERKRYLDEMDGATNLERIICLTGIRRSGKTTLVYQYIRRLLERGIRPERIVLARIDLCLADLDDIRDLVSVYKELKGIDPLKEKVYFFLDEVHSMKDWQVQVKEFIDMGYSSKIFVLGSSATSMFKDASESLAGRITFIHVHPLSFREYLEFSGYGSIETGTLDDMYNSLIDEKDMILHHLEGYVQTGGFPEWFKIVDIERWRRVLYEDYLSLILMKDVVRVFRIKDPGLLQNIVREVAILSCERFSYKGLSDRLDSNKETIRTYLHHLEASGLIHIMQKYSHKKISKERSEKKISFFDEGMRKAISLDLDSPRFSETMVASHLTAMGKEMSHIFKPYYWKNGREVDYVFRNREIVLPVETKYRNDPGDISGLLDLMEKYQLNRGIIVTKDDYRIEDHGDSGRIHYIPLWLFLLSDQQILGLK